MSQIILNKLKLWWECMRVYWASVFVYRLNFVLQMLGPILIFFIINYQLWQRIYSLSAAQTINGMDLSQMLHYHFFVMIVLFFAQGHTGINMSEEIRLGRISKYLIYPIGFFEFHGMQFVALEIIYLVFALNLAVVAQITQVVEVNWYLFPSALLYSFGVGIVWFFIQLCIGLLAFWLEETWVLRVMFNIGSQFLSGAIIPLSFFPKTWLSLLELSPFPYLTHYPVMLFQNPDILWSEPKIIIVPIFWGLFFFCLSLFFWRRGLKSYTGAGI